MPSILEDPSSKIPPPPRHTQSLSQNPALQRPQKSTLKSGAKVTLYPITKGPSSLPVSLLRYLHREFSGEIERGCTYPMEEAMGVERFGEYWFGVFGVIAVLDSGEEDEIGGLSEDRDWEKECLGTFYVKPNYPGMLQPLSELMDALTIDKGRCSHVCNAGFLTTTAARNQGVGMVMGRAYLHYAPLLVCDPRPLEGIV